MLQIGEEKFMKRCLDLAGRAEGMTYPNPMVGSVVVNNGKIEGEGYHLSPGGPHAEVIALESANDKSLLKSSTLFVSLEPCSHFGKTPPCADLIIKLQIPRVIIGTKDTSSKVSGKGIVKLKEAGVEVITGILEDECRWINRRFFTFHEKKRPYIILKWAQSADGYIDIVRTQDTDPGPHWITGNSERVLVHKWRSEEQSVLVGAGTIRTDKPSLNVRNWSGRDPLKLILSDSGNLGKYLTKAETKSPVFAFTYDKKADLGNATRVLLKKGPPASEQIAEYLFNQEVQSILIEGGGKVLNHFIETGLWDEARIFSGFKEFKSGISAPGISGKLIKRSDFGTSWLKVIINDQV